MKKLIIILILFTSCSQSLHPNTLYKGNCLEAKKVSEQIYVKKQIPQAIFAVVTMTVFGIAYYSSKSR